MAMARSVTVMEVSPRDGLQNESTILSTDDKLTLIHRALAAGFRRIEVTSFVHPARVPQMADAEAVCKGLPQRGDVTYAGLILNRRGYDRALATVVCRRSAWWCPLPTRSARAIRDRPSTKR